MLAHKLGTFPSAAGARSTSALIDEEVLIANIKKINPTLTNVEQYVRHFITKDYILLTVVDFPTPNGN